jgi:hypothetical protein
MVTIEDKAIRAKETLKWLGVYIDSRLTFKEHVTRKYQSYNLVTAM